MTYCLSAVINSVSSQYCTILIQDIYSENEISLKHVERKLSILYAISTTLSLPLILLVGRLSDNIIKIHYLTIIISLFEMSGLFLIIYKIDQITIFYDLGFIIIRVFLPILANLGIT